jgi:ribosome-binding protein aMBF1 (putative translation factor)
MRFPRPEAEASMSSKKVTRVTGSSKLSAEQTARDREVRRRVRGEFSPELQKPIPGSVSQALKRALETSDLTVYEIAKRAEVSQIIISRFLSGERDIRMATADKLAQVLGLKLVSSVG